MEKPPQSEGEKKVQRYIERILLGQPRSDVLQGLPSVFVKAIDEGLAAQVETLPEPAIEEVELVDDVREAQQKTERTEADKRELVAVREKLGMGKGGNLEKYEISLPNIDEIIQRGGGQIKVLANGTEVEFEELALGIDRDDDTAEVAFIRKKDRTKNKGIGVPLYVEIGKRLAEKGITLWSSGAQYGPGYDLWVKLAEMGAAERVGSRFRFINK